MLLAWLLLFTPAPGGAPGGARDGPVFEVEIRRTSFDIAHIRARDEAGLGLGMGYAYAQDNICLLADQILTVRGERSRYFGPAARTSEGASNLQADFFYRLINDPQTLQAMWQAQPAGVKQLLQGYAAGYNRYLQDVGRHGLPSLCRDAPWVRELSTLDLIRLARRYLSEAGAGAFLREIVTAQPPAATQSMPRPDEATAERLAAVPASRGSNAVAIGANLAGGAHGMLLANPHFPWTGAFRFYQMHLTLDGQLNVMGAVLPGLPVVIIGFSRELAWTHTVDTSSHFTLYRLELDPTDATRYRVDGTVHTMGRKTIIVDARRPDGSLTQYSRQFFDSQFGMLLADPQRFAWSTRWAYAIRDANLENFRVIAQWYAIDRARTLDELERALRNILGVPWANTLAVDRHGVTLYANLSVIPNVDAQRQSDCLVAPLREASTAAVFVLDGTRNACGWGIAKSAPQPGIFPAATLPVLTRVDYVQNSNDSAWLTNPEQPLSGFPDIVSRAGVPLGMRGRYALSHIRRAKGRIGVKELEELVMSDDVYLADLVLDDLLRLCDEEIRLANTRSAAAKLSRMCRQLASWDRRADLTSGPGYMDFASLMDEILKMEGIWAIPFDPADPVNTPRGLRISDRHVRSRLTAVLETVANSLATGSDNARWGAIQGRTIGSRRIPIHGGDGRLGVYNAISSVADSSAGREVTGGTSYLQVVTFTRDTPKALAILTYSQSSDPLSPNASDQTQRFSDKKWITLPFTEEQIRADAQYPVRILAATVPKPASDR